MSQIRNASDTTCKQLLRDGERFADLCNALYFHGRQVIKPENLISQENDVSTLIGKEPLPMETKDTEISSEKQVSMGIIWSLV